MDSTVLFVVGEPGLGKTTLVRSMLEPLGDNKLIKSPKWTLHTPPNGTPIAAAGHYTGATFDGADMVPYNGALAALEFWRDMLQMTPLTILDGDRFSNANAVMFFEGVRAVRTDLHLLCVLLAAPAEVAAARRAARGSDQNASWLKGRTTKSRRFFDTFPAGERIELDGTLTRTQLAVELGQFLQR